MFRSQFQSKTLWIIWKVALQMDVCLRGSEVGIKLIQRTSRVFAWMSALSLLLCMGNGRSIGQRAGGTETFPLVSSQGQASVLLSLRDAPVVRIAAKAFVSDVQAVTGRALPIEESLGPGTPVVVVAGTLGSGGLVDRWRAEKKIEVGGIEGHWETYAIRGVSDPAPGVRRALVVAGSDPRGTAYGILELSRRIGVSPWIWWADVPPPRRTTLLLENPDFTSKPPSVRYRGIFINDEDFGFRVWAGKTQDKDLGNIGPRAYARVFELLLRLRANTLWPAMHPGSRTFNETTDNAKLAAEYAIVMGSSHAEPMMRNNVAEWDQEQRGEWDYEHNRDAVLKYWDERAETNGNYENVYTMGMRGIHDSAMPGSGTAADKAKLVEKIVADQRAILARRVNPSIEKIPQVLWMYKEVLELYRAGMTIPADITLGWTDDNYGYIRQLSDSKERDRSGGSGVYYHVSYWGAPHDYLWLCTTPPELMREEMIKAYDYGARKIWILNVGDIKPAEIDIDYFMQLAWDEPGTAALDQEAFLRRWVGTQFPASHATRIAEVLDRYYRLNFARKPETMGFNRGNGAVQRTGYNPLAFGDQNLARRAAFESVTREAEAIGNELPSAYRDAYFELVTYPVEGASLMNRKMLLQDEAVLEAAQGRTAAVLTHGEAVAAYDAIQTETQRWQAIQNGKWDGMMSANPHAMAVFGPVGALPSMPAPTERAGVAIEGSAEPLGVAGQAAETLGVRAGWLNKSTSDPPALAAFNLSRPGRMRFFDVFNSSASAQTWSATSKAPWIVLDKAQGTLEPAGTERIHARLDSSKVDGQGAAGEIEVNVGGKTFSVPVSVTVSDAKPGTFIEDEGAVSIAAMHPAREVGSWRHLPGLSPSGDAMGIPDNLRATAFEPEKLGMGAPHLDFSFQTKAAASPRLEVLVLPCFPANAERKARYAVSVDEGKPIVVDTTGSSWEEGVLRNSNVTKVALPPLAAGRHTLRYWAIDPGVLVQHFVLHTAQGPNAYPVPPETEIIHEPF